MLWKQFIFIVTVLAKITYNLTIYWQNYSLHIYLISYFYRYNIKKFKFDYFKLIYLYGIN